MYSQSISVLANDEDLRKKSSSIIGMFFKNLFRRAQNPKIPIGTEGPLIPPAGHPGGLTEGDQEKCPFMNKDHQNKPKKGYGGGCPFMATDDDQKNPGLQLYEQAYDEDYVSKYRFYLSNAKLDFTYLDGKKRKNQSRAVFDSYPIYLQQTLFYDSDDLRRIRTLECCSRIEAYEELREKGNRQYHHGKYENAIDCYERALSLFKWLEYAQPEQIGVVSAQQICSKHDLMQEASESQTSKSKIQFNMSKNTSEPIREHIPQNQNKELDQVKKKYKEFFVHYCDQNTHLHDGQEMTETPDIDMRKSFLVQIYINMAAAYIKMRHYKLAVQCCIDAEAITDKVSQILLRKAQALALNKSAKREELNEALQIIDKAITNKPNERVFNGSTNQNILRILNLLDADEAYEMCRNLVQEKINQYESSLSEHKRQIFERLAEIYKIEQEIIQSGRQPTERALDHPTLQTSAWRISLKMKEKFLRVITFYIEGKKPEEVKAAKHQLQQVLRVLNTIGMIYSLKLQDIPAQLEVGDRTSQKIAKRLQKIKIDSADRVYSSGKYNYQVLEWAIKQKIAEDKKNEEVETKRKNEQAIKSNILIQQAKPNPNRYLWLLLILPLIVTIGSRFLF